MSKTKTVEKIAVQIRNQIINYILEQINESKKLAKKDEIISAFNELDREKLESFLEPYLKSEARTVENYKRILLIKIDGTFIFSSKKSDNLVGKKLSAQAYLESAFSESFVRSIITATNDVSKFTVNTIFNEPVLFICAPVIKDMKVLGTLVFELNEQKIYNFLHIYEGLGTTGESYLGTSYSVFSTALPSGALLISPTRLNPNLAFKYRSLSGQVRPTLMLSAVMGESGTGIGLDYRDKKVLGAWRFLPIVNWGLVTKQDLKEIKKNLDLNYYVLLFFIILSIILGLIFISIYWQLLVKNLEKLPFLKQFVDFSSKSFVIWLLTLSVLMLALVFFRIYQNYNNQRNGLLNDMIKTAQSKGDSAVDDINFYLRISQTAADMLAGDLGKSHPKQDDLVKRIKQNLAEYWYEILNITVIFESLTNSSNGLKPLLYSPSITRNSDGTFSQTDISKLPATLNFKDSAAEIERYRKKVNEDAQWHNPSIDKETNLSVATYSVPFVNEKDKIKGVVIIKVFMQFILHTVRSIVIGKTGYPFLADANGVFFYHPVKEFVENKKSIIDFAQEQANAELLNLAKQMLSGKKGMDSFKDEKAKEKIWLLFQPIKKANWFLGIVFDEKEVAINQKITRHTIVYLLLVALLGLLCATILLSLLFIRDKSLLPITISVVSSIVLVLALIVFLWIIRHASLAIDTKGVIITQTNMLDRYVQETQQESMRKHESVSIVIPTGLTLYILNFADPHHVSLVARIWQKFDPKKITQDQLGVQIPNAQQSSIEPIFSQKENDIEIKGWKIQALLSQNYNYKLFPFDVLHTIIPLEQKDLTKNLLLIPDLKSYGSLAPRSLPGIDKSVSLSGYTIKQSYFSFEPVETIATFGIKAYAEVTDRMLLQYNIIISRNLLNPIIIYFLPLIIVLLSIFVIFWLTSNLKTRDIKKYIYGIIGAYTGFLFALILLQRNLRSDYSVGEILYIEYFFFYTYLTILLFIVHAVFLYTYSKIEDIKFEVSRWISLLFWPAQLLVWLITTIFIFY